MIQVKIQKFMLHYVHYTVTGQHTFSVFLSFFWQTTACIWSTIELKIFSNAHQIISGSGLSLNWHTLIWLDGLFTGHSQHDKIIPHKHNILIVSYSYQYTSFCRFCGWCGLNFFFNIIHSCFLKMSEKRKRLQLYGVSVINKSLLCLVNVSNDLSFYASFQLIFIYLLFPQVKNETGLTSFSFNHPTSRSRLHSLSISPLYGTILYE